MRTQNVILIVAVTMLVSACSNIYGYVSRPQVNKIGTLTVVSTALTMGTGKTLTDHAVSLYANKDCSTVRTEQGRTYCREDEPNPAPTVHCYPTIGDVTCYAVPEATRSLDERVGSSY
ncbi:hypothetical protein [Magnetovibrio blakemorei]|nr:hypothetical protein [Magnetovibrio blakemorei]